jgi:hypothetical protein
MAKVFEFYVPKSLRKPLKWAPQPQCGKVIEFCSDKEISLAQPLVVWKLSGSTLHSLGSQQARKGRNTT